MVDPAHYHVRERRADKETGRVIGYRTRFHRTVGDALVDAGGALGEYVEVDPHPFVQKDTYIMSVGPTPGPDSSRRTVLNASRTTFGATYLAPPCAPVPTTM
jgi:hypothetical protein